VRGPDLTAQDVIKEAGVSLQTFYRYFPSRDRLVFEVIADWIRNQAVRLEAMAAGIERPVERLEHHVRRTLRPAPTPEFATAARFITSEHWRLHQHFPQEMAAVVQPFADLLRREIEAGTLAGEVGSKDPERDARVMTRTILGSFHHMSFFPDSPEAATAADDVWQFCLTALGQPTSAGVPTSQLVIGTIGDPTRERRARIVDSAIALMLRADYERIQMRDITATAGVAIATTYRYFASKDHLMAEALMTWGSRFREERPDEVTDSRSVDRLRSAFRQAVRAFEPHPTMYGALAMLQRSTDPHALELFEQFATRQQDAFEGYLFRLRPDRRTNIVRVMSAVLHTHLRAWASGRETIDEVYAMIDVAAGLLLDD